MRRALLPAVLFFLPVMLRGQGWVPQVSGTGNPLYSVFFIDNQHGWAVGYAGTIIRTTNGGLAWDSGESGTTAYLSSVCFADTNNGWVAGDTGKILRTTDGGLSWAGQISGTTNTLEAVRFIDARTGWVAGKASTVLHTSDGGSTWELQLSGLPNYLFSIYFADASNGWAVGGGGTIFHTSNGGNDWDQQGSGTVNLLESVYFTDNRTGTAVGLIGTIVRTTNGGVTWTTQRSGTRIGLHSVFFTDTNTGWATGYVGTILHTTDGGAVWSPQNGGLTNRLESVYFVDSNIGWCVGGEGTIIHTMTGGRGVQPPPSPGPVAPPNGSFVSTDPDVSWTPMTGALRYTLQISLSPFFLTYLLNRADLLGVTYQLNGLGVDSTYYWRVSMTDEMGTSGYSDAWSFETVSLPEGVALVMPEDGAGVPPVDIPFSWNPAQSGIDRYWFEFATNPAFAGSTIDSSLTDTATVVPLLEGNRAYWWRVRAHNPAGWGTFSDVWQFTTFVTGLTEVDVPHRFFLAQNHPNPFNPATTFEFSIPSPLVATLAVYDLLGREVATLLEEKLPAGSHTVRWDSRGSGLPTGVYFYRLKAGDLVQTKKLILLR